MKQTLMQPKKYDIVTYESSNTDGRRGDDSTLSTLRLAILIIVDSWMPLCFLFLRLTRTELDCSYSLWNLHGKVKNYAWKRRSN